MKKLGPMVFFMFILFIVDSICFAGFTAEARVKMLSGQDDNIEKIKPGDVLWGGSVVSEIIKKETKELFVLSLFDDEKIETTADQCFYISGGYSDNDIIMDVTDLDDGYWIKRLCPPSECFPEIHESSSRISGKKKKDFDEEVVVYSLKIKDKNGNKGYYFVNRLKAESE